MGVNVTVWIPERIDLLTVMWEQGYHGSEIAEAIGSGVTRSAVLSQVHRLQLGARRVDGRSPVKNHRAA